jgi:8-oxo-dGTP pyrophosphatase MutT (NUDIX family)
MSGEGCSEGRSGDGYAVQIEPGQEANLGQQTPARQAAKVILLRGGAEALQVLLVLRNPASRFMGGVWVFPGGAVDERELQAEHAHRLAARRELREEAGIELDPEAELVEFSRWITPSVVKVRFDTVFFLAQLPDGQAVEVDGQECVGHRWSAPAVALQEHAAGDLQLVFPTIKHLEQLASFDTADALLAHSRGRPIGPVQPRVVMDSGVPRVVLPGEPGY